MRVLLGNGNISSQVLLLNPKIIFPYVMVNRLTIAGSTEEHVVKARTTKQDDENMIIAMYAEEGNVRDHYQHFTAIVQISPKGDGSFGEMDFEV